MLNEIALRRLKCWTISSREKDLFQSRALGFELAQLGFKLKNIEDFTSTTREEFAGNLNVLREMRGDDVEYVPLFINFPDELPNDGEYLIRRIFGFLGLNTFDYSRFGADPITQMQNHELWQAATAAQAERLEDSYVEWIDLTVVTLEEAKQQLEKWLLDLLYSATPVKEALWTDILTVLDQMNIAVDITKVPVKENLARLAAIQWEKWQKIIVKTPTDLLRMFALIRGQDVSLASLIDLSGLKLSKPQRRELVKFLNECPALEEDLLRYKGLWVSISKWLHPGDLAKKYPKVAKAFDDLRNDRIKSFESLVINGSGQERLTKLAERPSIMLRKLTWLLKDFPPEVIADAVLNLEDQIASLPLPLLMNAYFAIDYPGKRLVINKKGKPYFLAARLPALNNSSVLKALDTLILTKLRGSKNWQKVWIDPTLNKIVLPLQDRKQSDGLLNLGRGSRLSIDSTVIRLFVYWQQDIQTTDLDLSAMKLDADFKYVEHIGWNSYDSDTDVIHSGDIQSAPHGAAEFIDIKLEALKTGYILPTILRYTGEEFSEMKACYAGWMKREDADVETKTFDAKTVAEKVNVNQDGVSWIPFIFDVVSKEIIYVDLYSRGSRTIETNQHFRAIAAALASYYKSKPTFADLASWYIRANNAIIVDRQDAETTIGLTDDCTVNVLKLVGQGVTSF